MSSGFKILLEQSIEKQGYSQGPLIFSEKPSHEHTLPINPKTIGHLFVNGFSSKHLICAHCGTHKIDCKDLSSCGAEYFFKWMSRRNVLMSLLKNNNSLTIDIYNKYFGNFTKDLDAVLPIPLPPPYKLGDPIRRTLDIPWDFIGIDPDKFLLMSRKSREIKNQPWKSMYHITPDKTYRKEMYTLDYAVQAEDKALAYVGEKSYLGIPSIRLYKPPGEHNPFHKRYKFYDTTPRNLGPTKRASAFG